jgi:hypothetical protein
MNELRETANPPIPIHNGINIIYGMNRRKGCGMGIFSISFTGSSIASNGHDVVHCLHFVQFAGVMLRCHFEKRDTQFSKTPYGHRNLQ